MMLLAAHQPNFAPYAGFFDKMMRVDLFDIAIYDQLARSSDCFYHRVKIGGNSARPNAPKQRWWTLPIDDHAFGKPIKDAKLDLSKMPRMWAEFSNVYQTRTYFQQAEDLFRKFFESPSEWMWEFNFRLILAIRDALGISTPLAIANKPVAGAVPGLISVCSMYKADKYLAGSGGGDHADNNLILEASKGYPASILVTPSVLEAYPSKGNSVLEMFCTHEKPAVIFQQWRAMEEFKSGS